MYLDTTSKIQYGIYYNVSNRGGVASGTLSIGTRYHVVATRSKTNGLEMFINGISVDTDPYTGNGRGWSDGNRIGSSGLHNFKMNASVDQIKIFTRVLENYEITNLYNGGAGC